MKQVLQDLKSGRTIVADVPAPQVRPGAVRIATSVSLVSAGTERMLVEFARGSLLSKARQQPERVKEALQKVVTDGLMTTVEAIRAKLDQPMLLGYCNVGRVVEVGAGVRGLSVGDRVVSNGSHAEVVVVPQNLVARLPDGVEDDEAAFTVLGAIALQGVRLAAPTIGESFVVMGLGLIGLMTVQILRANGCRVLGIDFDPERLALARGFGAETFDPSTGADPVAAAEEFSRGRGVDGVLLTLSTTSSDPVAQAARMCRKRGRIVLVGVTGLELNRADFYEKELSFQVSCSYGPGRYDPAYEEKGQDYPLGFVRWTEQRNFEAVLDLMQAGRLDTRPLVTHRFAVAEAEKAYDVLGSGEKSIGILIEYPRDAAAAPADWPAVTALRTDAPPRAAASVSFIGAGAYSSRTLVQAFKSAGADLQAIVSSGGVSAVHYGRKFGFRQAASEARVAIEDPATDAVCIATRHDSHARYVTAALAAGKHVFVEKPLCLTLGELGAIEAAAAQPAPGGGAAPLLMVGFNRRFAPMVVKTRELLQALPGPKSFIMIVNAGAIPADHWTQDPAVGGGRIVGEGCHFIDLLRHLAGSPIVGFDAAGLDRPGGPPLKDTVIIRLSFADGSIGVINYLANGHKTFPKERLEVFASGRIIVLDNYRRLTAHGVAGFRAMRTFGQDKGQRDCARAFVEAVRSGGPSPIPLDEIIEVSRVSIEAAAQAG
ncbi:bi-domain-containing oxidoreductase [Phenylobacterium sp.]|uniref:bi-domain-containing oxidoreductase n=1 Tax=Phenylobacterium sp. TaxID=1871053 RepID=UPI002FE0BB36